MSFLAGLTIGGSHHSASVGVGVGIGVGVDVDKKWIEIPDLTTHCVQDTIKIAVDEYNIKYEDYLKYKSVIIGWYEELDGNKIRYRFHIQAIDCLGRVRTYEAMVLEDKVNGEITKILESFKPITV